MPAPSDGVVVNIKEISFKMQLELFGSEVLDKK